MSGNIQTAAVVGLATYFPDSRSEFREMYEGTHMAVEVMVPISWAPMLTLSSTLGIVTPEIDGKS